MSTEEFATFLLTKGINVSEYLLEFKTSKLSIKDSNKPMEVYTDGACSFNGKGNVPGGVGVYSSDYSYKISEKYENATNNKMELRAIKEALVLLSNEPVKKETIIYSDSTYSIKCCTLWCKSWSTNGWKTSKGQPVENKEIIQEIITLLNSNSHVYLKYVKAHNGNPGNEMADKLATSAIKT
jgi:ribonuclease HI